MGDDSVFDPLRRVTIPCGDPRAMLLANSGGPPRAEQRDDIADLRRELARRNAVAYDIDHFVAALRALTKADRRGGDWSHDANVAVDTIGLLSRELRGFADLSDLRRKPACVVGALERALRYARPRLGERVAISRAFFSAPVVLVQEVVLLRVFLNVIVVAVQSLEARDDGGGELGLEVDATPRGAIVQLRDNGDGSERAGSPDRQRFIDAVGHAGALVARSGGRLEITTRPGLGRLVRITLPLADGVDGA
jgi:signal transduction histidine kinase